MGNRHWLFGLLGVLTLVGPCRTGLAEDSPLTWSWSWRPSTEETAAPRVEVCPLLYDKRWAYAVEIDDGPTSTLTVAQPLLSKFSFTEAPPGVKGGKVRPFVGGSAVMVQWVGTSNPTHLSWEQLVELERQGWGVLNHSYWHTGNHWDPTQALQPADFRRELFWSRAILEAVLGHGRGEAHFVFPNGDFHYGRYLGEFEIRSASRVGGSCRTLRAEPSAFLDIDRNWLDESVWAKSSDPMDGFPKPGPKAGDLVIDFTHEIEPGPDSKNYRRWSERLSTIAARFGKEGDDTVWSAATTDIIRYTLAARVAKVEVGPGRLTVQLPGSSPESPLTLKLSGLSERSELVAPPGGSLHRQADKAWITTPRLARQRVGSPRTTLKRIYQGPVRDLKFDEPQAIAGVRLLQQGKAGPLKIELVHADGKAESLLAEEPTKLKEQWGCWLLFPTVPDRPAIVAKGVRIAEDPGLKEMEIWALAESR